MSARFEPGERSRLKRRPQRGSHDEAAVFGILDAGFVCHLGYAIDGQSFVTPTAYWRDGRRLFWHGSAQSRMIAAQARGLAVCLAVTLLDGLVLGRTGFTHSLQYRSAMAFGRAALVAGDAAKRAAMQAFIERLYPGRWQTLRPIDQSELDAISVITMTIEEASAKVRAGGVNEKDEDLGFPCWAGVIPVHQVVAGAAMPEPGVAMAAPANVAAYAEGAPLDEVLARLAGSAA